MSDHARLSPSSSSRWTKCPGSAIDPDQIPDTTNDAAEEGTYAHTLSEGWLSTGEKPDFQDNADMERAVTAYVDFVNEIEGDRLLEQTLHSIVIPEHFGTIDCLILAKPVMYVVDFKYGLFEVSPEDNTQLKCYLNIAREHFTGYTEFYGAIVQPRVFKPYFVEFKRASLDRFRQDCVRSANSAEKCAGPHCRYCPLIADCSVARLHNIQLAKTSFDEVSGDGEVSERIQKALDILHWRECSQALEKHAEATLFQLAMQGEKIPGKQLVQSLSNRKWKDPEQAYKILRGRGLRKKDIVKEQLLTPAQMEKVAEESVVADLCHREEKGPTLAGLNSKFAPYDPVSKFTELETEE